jgi:photosystem II stability/assembly factor-like uncharacterized protein
MAVTMLIGTAVITACNSDDDDVHPTASPTADIGTVQRIVFASEQTAIVQTENGVEKTADLSHWSDITPDLPPGAYTKSVFFANDKSGWLLTAEHTDKATTQFTMYSTGNGGSTWSSSSVGPAEVEYNSAFAGPASIYYSDPLHGWVAIQLPTSSNFSQADLYGTEDGGSTWNKLAAPAFGELVFATARDGWLAGGPNDTDLFLTHDAGRTWSPDAIQQTGDLTVDAVFSPPALTNNGLVLAVAEPGAGGRGTEKVFTSTDGAVWSLAATVPDLPLEFGARAATSVVSASGTWFLAVSPGDKIYSQRPGDSEVKVISSSGLPSTLAAIDFANDTIGWAYGGSGSCAKPKSDCSGTTQVLRTTDGGEHWSVLLSHTSPSG